MPTSPRRASLEPGREPDHTGLYLNRFLREIGTGEVISPVLAYLASRPEPAVYSLAFERWRRHRTGSAAPGAVTFTATLRAALAVGLGSASVTEVGLTLHHTYGVPVLPGSALKGMCRRGFDRWATETGLPDSQRDAAISILFGDTASAGYVTFWDAWYVPRDGHGPLHPDTITVHHPRYYQKQEWPQESEDPTPVPFLVVPVGSAFIFSLDAPTPSWAQFAESLLRWSLDRVGAGAKTNAGYGCFNTATRNPARSRQATPAAAVAVQPAFLPPAFTGTRLEEVVFLGRNKKGIALIRRVTGADPDERVPCDLVPQHWLPDYQFRATIEYKSDRPMSARAKL